MLVLLSLSTMDRDRGGDQFLRKCMRSSVKSLSGQISRRKNCAIFIIFIFMNRLQGKRGGRGGGEIGRGVGEARSYSEQK